MAICLHFDENFSQFSSNENKTDRYKTKNRLNMRLLLLILNLAASQKLKITSTKQIIESDTNNQTLTCDNNNINSNYTNVRWYLTKNADFSNLSAKPKRIFLATQNSYGQGRVVSKYQRYFAVNKNFHLILKAPIKYKIFSGIYTCMVDGTEDGFRRV